MTILRLQMILLFERQVFVRMNWTLRKDKRQHATKKEWTLRARRRSIRQDAPTLTSGEYWFVYRN